MKKTIALLTTICIATTFLTSCSDDCITESVNGKIIGKTIDASTDVDSKVFVDDRNGQFKWHQTGEKLAVLEIYDDGTLSKFGTEDSYYIDEDCRNAVFTINVAEKASGKYLYTGIYPFTSCGEPSDMSHIVLNLPEQQTPEADNYDPAADLMVSQSVESGTQKAPAAFNFSRVASIAKMTLSGIPAGEKISNVVIETPDNLISGTLYMNAADGSVYKDNTQYPFGSSHSLTLNMQERMATGEDAVWFTLLPADLSNGGKMNVSVTTDKGTYSKAIATEGRELKFISGDLTRFQVTLGNTVTVPEEKVYEILKDAKDLRVGDEVIIMANYAGHYDERFRFAIGTYTSGPAAGQLYGVNQTFNGNVITDLADRAIAWKIEAGTQSGSFALKSTNNTGAKWEQSYGKYLSLTRNAISNTATAVTDETSLKFEVTNANGLCAVSSVAAPNARMEADYSSDEDGWFYSGYAADIYIYYAPLAPRVELPALETPVVSASSDGKDVTVSWNDVANAGSYTVTCGTSTETVTSTSKTFEMDWEQTYDITVIANPSDASLYAPSEAGTASVTTGAEPDAPETTVTFDFPGEWQEGTTPEPFVKDAITVTINSGSWRENCFWMGSSGSFSIRVQTGRTITKIAFTAPSDATLKIKDEDNSWSVSGGTYAEYTTPYEGNMRFNATGSTKISQIKVTCK